MCLNLEVPAKNIGPGAPGAKRQPRGQASTEPRSTRSAFLTQASPSRHYPDSHSRQFTSSA